MATDQENIKLDASAQEEIKKRSEDMLLSNIEVNGKKGSHQYNIVDQYPWTLTPPTNRIGIPYMEMIEYEQDLSTLYSQLKYWGSGALGLLTGGTNPYRNLYHAIPTGTSYILPYFEPEHTRNNPQWAEKGGILDFSSFEGLVKIITGSAQLFNLAPGVAINRPKQWDGTQPYSFNVNFTLFNTFPMSNTDDSNPRDIINKNLQFTQRLRMSALHSQQNIILASPPAIFEIFIPGIRYSPAAAITQVNITNLGQMNLMNVNNKNINVPDAYQILITITELITESREILSASVKGTTESFSKVRAILETTDPKTPTFDQYNGKIQ